MHHKMKLHQQFIWRAHDMVVRKVLLREIMDAVKLNGLYMEFGVWVGNTINHIAQLNPTKTVYGFDWWQGLPEDWPLQNGQVISKGAYSNDGHLPVVEPNVQLVSGLFEDSLPNWVDERKKIGDVAAFVHIDCDLYSSTKTILKNLTPLIVPGTVVTFDEYPYGESKAFEEWLETSDLTAYVFYQNEKQASFIMGDGIENPVTIVPTWSVNPEIKGETYVEKPWTNKKEDATVMPNIGNPIRRW